MRVLIADDDRAVAATITKCVQACKHEVVDTVTSGGLAVIQSFARHQPDVVLLDIQMPRCNGLTVCHALLSRKPDTKIIFVSGRIGGDHPFVTDAGAFGYLQKPVHFDALREVLDSMAQ